MLFFLFKYLLDLKKHFNRLVPKFFELDPNLSLVKTPRVATQASNNVWKNTHCVDDFWRQVAKFVFNVSILLFFQVSETSSGNVENLQSGLNRLCATHFLTLLQQTSLGFDPYIGNHGARSTNQPLCYAAVTSRPIA